MNQQPCAENWVRLDWHAHRVDSLLGGHPVQLLAALARFVKLMLAAAICLLFLRAIFWPTPLDMVVLLLLFIVFATMFIGVP